MACSSREWCDFVLMSGGVLFVERILFEPSFWSECEKKMKDFYFKYFLDELVYPQLQ